MNNDKCRWECKNPKEHNACEKYYLWNPSTCTCENGEYLASIINDSVIICDEIIEITKSTSTETVPTKNTPTNFNEKKITFKTEKIVLASLLNTIALLIAVSIYCCFIKYRPKQKYCHITTPAN